MDADQAQSEMRKALAGFISEENRSAFNTAVWNIAKRIGLSEKNAVKSAVKAEQDKAKSVKKEESKGEAMSKLVQKFLDNPLDTEEEGKYLRAILHAGLSTGEIHPQILDKIDRIIGISSGEDDKISVVDFSTAFKDLDESIQICRKQQEKKGKGYGEEN